MYVCSEYFIQQKLFTVMMILWNGDWMKIQWIVWCSSIMRSMLLFTFSICIWSVRWVSKWEEKNGKLYFKCRKCTYSCWFSFCLPNNNWFLQCTWINLNCENFWFVRSSVIYVWDLSIAAFSQYPSPYTLLAMVDDEA